VNNHGWGRFNGKLWQRNYWEHIIRDEASLNNVRKYILNNPVKWAEDKKHGQLYVAKDDFKIFYQG
jgi:putative transposase